MTLNLENEIPGFFSSNPGIRDFEIPKNPGIFGIGISGLASLVGSKVTLKQLAVRKATHNFIQFIIPKRS